MGDAHRARAERRTTRVAQTAPAGSSGARHSPLPVVNAATSPDTQEQKGSSQPATEQANGCTATPSLVRASRLASRAQSEMPRGQRSLSMATELLRYQPSPNYHHDWLQRIKELVAASRDSAAFSYSL
ncbi:hypothetical protein D1007_23031 [Hordeum vulgare]|nr:hypothetical protein D1007_23031 [Hordeum vulgare]